MTKYSEIAKVLGINVREMGLDANLDLDRVGDRIKYAFFAECLLKLFHMSLVCHSNCEKLESHAADVSDAALERISGSKRPYTFFRVKSDPHCARKPDRPWG